MDIDVLSSDREAVIQREMQGLPPLPLTAEVTDKLIHLCKNPPVNTINTLQNLLIHRIEPGINHAAYLKAKFLLNVAKNNIQTPVFNAKEAIAILGTMGGGHNISVLSELLDYDDSVAQAACHELARNVFLFDIYDEIVDRYQVGHIWAKRLLMQWSEATWLKTSASLPNNLKGVVFKVAGVINAQQLSPIQAAWNRDDIPLHSQSLLQSVYPRILEDLYQLKQQGQPIIFVTEQISLDKARKRQCESALNALLWHFGEKMPYFPNRAYRGIMVSAKIDPVFQKWAEYYGTLCIEADIQNWQTGDILEIKPYENCILSHKDSAKIFIKERQINIWKVGGSLRLQLGQTLTQKSQTLLQPKNKNVLLSNVMGAHKTQHYSLAQKIVGQACQVIGLKPGDECEPYVAIVEAPEIQTTHDTKIGNLPYLGFSVELMLKTFQHPNLVQKQAYPHTKDNKGYVMLKPGDGMVHAWLNRLLLPTELGVRENTYSGFPVGLSFAAEHDEIALAAHTGKLAFEMPESILIRFSGEIQQGIMLRDLVYAIPYIAAKKGLLIPNSTQNIFANRVIEIIGLSHLTTEQAFEFNEASVDWGAAACILHLSHKRLQEHAQSGIKLLQWMIKHQYHDASVLRRRISAMQAWLKKNEMLDSDPQAEYAATMEIDLNTITEPLLASLQNPQCIVSLSAIASTAIDGVFIGGAEIFMGNYRVVGEMLRQTNNPLKIPLWLTPASKLESLQLMQEGYYALYTAKGVGTGMPDHHLCMSNQLKHTGKIVTSAKRAFLKKQIPPMQGYLSSPALASLTAVQGYLPKLEEYQSHLSKLEVLQSQLDKPIDFYHATDNPVVL